MEQFTAQAENLQAIGENAEKYLAIIGEWVNGTEGLLTFSAEGSPGTDQRDAAAQSATLRVTPDQIKGLLLALAEELSRDEAFSQMLPGPLPLDEIKALVPTGNAMELTIYVDEHEGIAGIDGVVPALFGDGSGATGRFAYDRLTSDGLERHSVGGEISEQGGNLFSFSLKTESDSADPQAPKGSFNLGFRQSDNASTTDMMLDHTYARALAADRETLESKTDINVLTKSGGFDSTMSATLDFASDARALGADDVVCESSLGLSFMGMKMGNVLMTLATSAYVPADVSGNEIVDLTGLNEAGGAALTEELNAGLTRALESAMSLFPQETIMQLTQLM